MPRITGTNIAEHVAEQEQTVFDAATRLFAEHGVNNVAMATIADNVGLARTSLYRYFPNKAAIVNCWFDLAIGPLIADCDSIAQSSATRAERFTTWVERQIDFLSDPHNQAMIRASTETDELDDHQRSEIGARHRELYASLHAIIADQSDASHDTTNNETVDHATAHARTMLVAGVLRHLDDLTTAGTPERVARAELLRAANLIAGIDDTP